jgi:hypothetical protein
MDLFWWIIGTAAVFLCGLVLGALLGKEYPDVFD